MTHEREDLLRDARALSPRVQFRLRQGGAEAVVFAGFRGGALSLYFGNDPAYHFNSQGELRRAFAGDRLIKAEDGRLVSMRRVRTTTEVGLHAEPFSEGDQQQFLDNLARRLSELKAGLASASIVVEGQVPPDGDAVERLAVWLARNGDPMPAASPHVT